MQNQTYITRKSFKHRYKKLTEEKGKSYIGICGLNGREYNSHAQSGKPEISKVDSGVCSILYRNRKSNMLVNFL